MTQQELQELITKTNQEHVEFIYKAYARNCAKKFDEEELKIVNGILDAYVGFTKKLEELMK